MIVDENGKSTLLTKNVKRGNSRMPFFTQNNEIELFNAIIWFFFFEITASNKKNSL